MLNDTTRQCRYTGDDGTQCKAAPMRRKQYCFFHDPAMKNKRLAASRDGGLRRGQRSLASLKLPPDMFTRPLEFHTNGDLAELLRQMLVRICSGEVNPLLASIVEQTVKTMLKARDRDARDQDFADYAAIPKDGAVQNLLVDRLVSHLTEEPGA
jgi:hypothetical protein